MLVFWYGCCLASVRKVIYSLEVSVKTLIGIAVVSGLVACSGGGAGEDTGGGIDCTADVRSSVVVLVSDQNGDPLNDGALVYYSIDGGEDQLADNMGIQGHFYAGQEEAGLFRIFAEYRQEDFDGCLWSDETEAVEIEVIANECHVETQEVALVLSTDLSDCD